MANVRNRARHRLVAQMAAAAMLACTLASCSLTRPDDIQTDDGPSEAAPRYETVDADLCDEIAPLLDDLRQDLAVSLHDEIIATDRASSGYEVAECYAQLSGRGPGIYPQVIVWTVASLGDSTEAGEAYQAQQEVTPVSGQGFESGSEQSVDGFGEQAVALARAQQLYDESWSEYRLIARDRNLVLRIDLAFVSDAEYVARSTMADLVHPLASSIAALIPQSRPR